MNEKGQQAIVSFGIDHVAARRYYRFPIGKVAVYFAALHGQAHLRGALIPGDDVELGAEHLVEHERQVDGGRAGSSTPDCYCFPGFEDLINVFKCVEAEVQDHGHALASGAGTAQWADVQMSA